MSNITIVDLTEDRSCEALIVSGHDGAQPNRALVDALTLTHRMRYELVVRDGGPTPDLSPEGKLLRAIFGESASQAMVAQAGASLSRGDGIITRHPHGSVTFQAAFRCEVEEVIEETSGLPDDMKERYRVTVKWSGPLTVGDVLLANGEALGVIDGIRDDGSSEPRLYLGSFASRAARITRRLPTAMQRMTARAIGEYEALTESPVDGRELRLDQLEWLAEAGGRPIVSEMATYTSGDPRQRAVAFEAVLKLEPPDQGGRSAFEGDDR